MFGSQTTDPIGCNVTSEHAHQFCSLLILYDWHEHSHWTVGLLPLSPYTQPINSNIYINSVNMQLCLLSVGSFFVEEWRVEDSSNFCWRKKKKVTAPHSGRLAWGCPSPSRIRQSVFFRGGSLLSGQASIILFLTTWLKQEGRKTKGMSLWHRLNKSIYMSPSAKMDIHFFQYPAY